MFTPQTKDFRLCSVPNRPNLPVGKAHLLCLAQSIDITGVILQHLFLFYNIFQLANKEWIYSGCRRYILCFAAKPQKLGNRINAVVCTDFDILQQLRF